MRKLTILMVIVITFGLLSSAAAKGGIRVGNSAAIINGDPLIIQFGQNQSSLNDASKARIRAQLKAVTLGRQDKILVVGHTDSSGDEDKNHRLSLKRAQMVRREIVSGLGIAPAAVLTLPMGEQSPVADNGRQAGRAQNRRVEIFLAQVVGSRPMDGSGRTDPDQAVIEGLVQDARAMLRRRQVSQSLQTLQKARAQGGDENSNWHALYGIVGYYAGVPAVKIKAHLTRALQLDAHNMEAREYLGRLEAQHKVADGLVTPAMGQTLSDAIAVTAPAQDHEYLRLFKVHPIESHKLSGKSVTVWQCLDGQGESVVYYFDHTRVFTWAFALNNISAQAPTPSKGVSRASPMTRELPVSARQQTHAANMSPSAHPRVWESKLFQ